MRCGCPGCSRWQGGRACGGGQFRWKMAIARRWLSCRCGRYGDLKSSRPVLGHLPTLNEGQMWIYPTWVGDPHFTHISYPRPTCRRSLLSSRWYFARISRMISLYLTNRRRRRTTTVRGGQPSLTSSHVALYFRSLSFFVQCRTELEAFKARGL